MCLLGPPSPLPLLSGFSSTCHGHFFAALDNVQFAGASSIFDYRGDVLGFWIQLLCATSTEIEAAYAVGRLPPIPSSCCLIAWRAEKAGALPTVWRHFVEFHYLSASHYNFVSEHGYVVSTPFLGRNVKATFAAIDGRVVSTSLLCMHNVTITLRRVVSAPGLHWLPAYLELSLCIIIEPARSQVRAAQRHHDHVFTARRPALEVRVPVFHETGGSQPADSKHVFYW